MRAVARPTAHIRRHRVAGVIVAAATVVAATLAGLILPTAAAAAEFGPGYQPAGHPLDHLGGYLTADGTVAYCIDLGEPSTIGGATADHGVVEQVNALDPETTRRLNVVLSAHGSTMDADTAAAVAMVVWGLADADAYRFAGGDASVLSRAPASARESIQSLADAFRSEAAAFIAPTSTISTDLRIAEGDDYTGSLTVTTIPADAAATATLTNAVFSDTGSPTREGFLNGQVLPITATPPGTSAYRVSVAAKTTSSGGPAAAVRLFTTPGAQTLVAAAPPTLIDASTTAIDTRDRRVPAVITVSQPTGVVGGTVTDTAIVTGIPSTGADLVWAGYLQPSGAGTPACTDAERIFSSWPTRITGDGSYTSEFVVRPEHVGTVYWIATVTVDGTAPIADRCGAEGEVSTLVAAPELPVVSG